MKKRCFAALAAMVLAGSAFAAKFPSYLMVDGTTVTGVKNQKKLPANLVIPDGVTEIGKRAFRGCTSLASVSIPASVTYIGGGVFSGCTSLTEIQFKGTTAQWQAIQGSGQIQGPVVRCTDGHIGIEEVPEYLKIMGTRVTGYTGTLPANLVIPDGVTEIGERAFRGCTSLASVTIPDTVTAIGGIAFYGCTSLASVIIPGSVTGIGEHAFLNCTSLKKVQFGGTVAQWKALKGSDEIKIPSIRCTDGHIGIEEVPEYLKIAGTTVTGYTGTVPANLVIPDGVMEIGYRAFKNCASIESVAIPGSVKIIGGGFNYDDGAFKGCTYLKRVTIAEGVTEIDRNAFSGCTSLASVTIPGSVTEIGDYAFSNCTSLKKVQFGGTTAQWKALKGSDGVKTPYILCGDGYIGVKEVPDYLKMDGTKVAGYTDKVPANLVIPDGVTSVGGSAFYSCKNLVSVEISNGVTEIGGYAFHDCTSLASVTIPNSVTEIGNSAFKNCTSLEKVQFGGTTADWKAVKGSDGVKVPSIRCTDGYIGVKEFPAYLKMDGTTVTGYTGKVSANLVIPDGVTEIGSDAFKDCASIESVTIPGSVKIIGGYGYNDGAFKGCTYLERVTIAEGVTEIGRNAFSGCMSLASVTIPGSVTHL